MSDSRPAYGEYATPEEQARRMGVEPALAPEPVSAPEPPAPRSAAPEGERKPLLAPLTGARRIDRFFAVFLVAWGLVSVIRDIPMLIDLPSFFYEAFDAWGIQAELADPSGARAWGTAAAFVLGVGWLLTALWTWQRTRRGKLVFWVPLVGAVATYIVVAVLISMPLSADEALLQSLIDQMEAITAP